MARKIKTNWEAIEGWLYPEEGAALRRLAANKRVLEIGGFRGRSTVAMAQVAEHVTTLDHWRGDEYTNKQNRHQLIQCYLDNLDAYGVQNKVTPIIGDYVFSWPAVKDQHFDLVFYDADHSGPATRNGMVLANRCFPGAVLAVHDYNNSYDHYKDAYREINEMAKRYGAHEVVGTLFIMYPK